MVSLTSLWLPILISAVLVFVASFVIHMFIGHAADYGRAPSEDAVMDALRGFSIPPGDYGSCPGRLGARDPAFVAKHKKGPVLMMTVFPAGNLGMGKQLAAWFVYCVGHRHLRGIPDQPRAAGRRAIPRGVSIFSDRGVRRLRNGLWQQSIWQAQVGNHDQVQHRCTHLRLVDRRRVRLVVAFLASHKSQGTRHKAKA